MKIHEKQEHHLPGVGYWGKRGEVSVRVNFAIFEPGQIFPEDPKHFHETRTTYFCVLAGSVSVEVEGKEVLVTSGGMLEVEPEEVYRVLSISEDGCTYLVIGSHNENDRVEVD